MALKLGGAAGAGCRRQERGDGAAERGEGCLQPEMAAGLQSRCVPGAARPHSAPLDLAHGGAARGQGFPGQPGSTRAAASAAPRTRKLCCREAGSGGSEACSQPWGSEDCLIVVNSKSIYL